MTTKSRPETILLVEDDPSLLKLVGIQLQGLGYTVKSFANPQKALAWVQAHTDEPVDLTLCDMRMPNMNGLDCCRQFAELRPQIPCILMSGQRAGSIEGMNSGGNIHFLDKPFTEATLGAKVREVLDQ